MNGKQIKKLEYKFNHLRDRKRYFHFVEPTLKKPTLIINDAGKFVFVKAFEFVDEVFIAVVRTDENENNRLITLAPNAISKIKNLIKKEKIVSPDITSGKLSSIEDLGAIKIPPELSQFSLIQISLPAKLKKNSTLSKNDNKKTGIVNSTDLGKMKFETINLTGKWANLIGKMSNPFHIMFYGMPGSGKSTIAIQFAHYLASAFDFKILYVAREEGISKTIQEKFKRLKAMNKNIDISENIAHLARYDVVVFDSNNEIGLSAADLKDIQVNNPHLSTINVLKATKQGKYLGTSDYGHLVQAEFRCENMRCFVEKNRFGGSESIDIFLKIFEHKKSFANAKLFTLCY